MPMTITQGQGSEPTPGPTPDPGPSPGPDPTGSGTTSGTTATAGTGGTTTTSSTASADISVITNLTTQMNNLSAQITNALNNTSSPNPPPGEPGHVNKMLIAQFPSIALAMLTLASILASMGYEMNELSEKLMQATQQLGKAAGELQALLTKAQMMQTKGEMAKDISGIGIGLGSMAFGASMERSESSSFNKADGKLNDEQTAAQNKLDYFESESNAASTGAAKTLTVRVGGKDYDDFDNLNTPVKNNASKVTAQRAKVGAKEKEIEANDRNLSSATGQAKIHYEQEKTKLESEYKGEKKKLDDLTKPERERDQWVADKKSGLTKDINGLQRQRDDLRSAHSHKLSSIQTKAQLFGQMGSQLGGIIGSAMTLASQAAQIPLQKLQAILQTAAQPLMQQALQNSESSAQSIQAAFDSVLQSLKAWEDALAQMIKMSH